MRSRNRRNLPKTCEICGACYISCVIAGLGGVAGRSLSARVSWSLTALALVVGCASSGADLAPARTRVRAMEPARPIHREPEPVTAPSPAPVPGPGSVVVITLDGIRWQEVFRGVDPVLAKEYDLGTPESATRLVPNLQHLMGQGAVIGAPGHGAIMSAVGPAFISMPGYVEILRGRAVPDCWSNDCSLPEESSLLEELAARPDLRPGDVALFASWHALDRFAAERVLVSAGRQRGSNLSWLEQKPELASALNAGRESSERLGGAEYRPDRHTAELALTYLRTVHPRFLFVSLGDSDELGHTADYPGYLDALREADRFVGRVVSALKEIRATGAPATLVVTTDHGRDSTAYGHGPAIPQSGRVWLVAWGDGIRSQGFVASPRPRYLIDIAPTLRSLLGLPADERPDSGRVLTELVSETM